MALKDSNILITGVSGGIGKAILEGMSKEVAGGHGHVFTAARRPISEFWTGDYPSNSTHVQADLTSEVEVKKLMQVVSGERGGRLDVLVNCVGGSLYSNSIEEFPASQVRAVMEVNLVSAFLITKHAIPLLRAAGGGNIVHLVSSSAKKISRNKAPYGMAKAGLAHFINYAATELAGDGIVVNGLSPTYVFTSRHENDIERKVAKTGSSREEVQSKIIDSQLIRRPLLPSELVPAVLFLSETRCITGTVIDATMGETVGT